MALQHFSPEHFVNAFPVLAIPFTIYTKDMLFPTYIYIYTELGAKESLHT